MFWWFGGLDNCFGYFFQNLADFYQSSGHPDNSLGVALSVAVLQVIPGTMDKVIELFSFKLFLGDVKLACL
jgi:hypothetical protein